mmetsp:Transcript_5208/g.13608  ORF Transcript_5208/g.13608 Transcript_5208/m.13608 type:complete len:109 (-) Transcript_5208:171-497(-)
MVGAFKGSLTTAHVTAHLAISPLWLFPGLPLHAAVQVFDSRPEAARTLTLACLGAPLLPMYTKLALQASAFLMLKSWFIGGLCGSIIGGRHVLRWLSKLLKRRNSSDT